MDFKEDFAIFGDYLYFEKIGNVLCKKSEDLQKSFDFMEKQKGFFVGYLSYEALSVRESETPLLEFLHFKKRKKISKNFESQSFFAPCILKALDKDRFFRDFVSIKNALKKGNSYQVNYTQELNLKTHCDSFGVFKSLLSSQNTKYKGFFKSENIEILSFSPELFFKKKKNIVTLQPMKGTIKRDENKKQDKELKKTLKKDSKNRSENMMIVDLLRNDISKIAKIGSLRVKKLCKILSFKTLHQMVSTLKADIGNSSLFDIFSAIYPCGSITGAPKKSTMEIIQSLENRERSVYCGAFGVICKKEAIFNVPIRTLFKKQGDDFFSYGVGSGIVWESEAKSEFEELNLKTSFLFEATKEVKLLETMLMRGGKVFLLSLHLKRLLKTAKDLGYKQNVFLEKIHLEDSQKIYFKKDILELQPQNLLDFWEELDKEFIEKYKLKVEVKDCVLRLLLDKKGNIFVEQKPLLNIDSQKIEIAKEKIESQNDFLYIKSTYRKWYEKHKEGLFDSVFFNEKNELCEGARSNIVLLKDGEYLTPCVQSGLLRGVFREFLLDSGMIKEQVLSLKDLKEAEKIYCINSVRGVVEVHL